MKLPRGLKSKEIYSQATINIEKNVCLVTAQTVRSNK